jgi:hypothetical protein
MTALRIVNLVKEQMTIQKINARTLSKRAGMDTGLMSRILNGHQKGFNIDTAQRLLKAAKLPWSVLDEAPPEKINPNTLIKGSQNERV